MSHVQKVQVLAEPRDGIDGSVREVAALLQHQVPKPWRHVDDLLNGAVSDPQGRAEIEDSQLLKRPRGRERKEGGIVDQVAASQADLPERPAFGEERGNCFVANEPALLEVDLEDVGAVFGEGKNGVVLDLRAIVEFKLRRNVSISARSIAGKPRSPTLLIALHRWASRAKLSLEIRWQPDMFRPCSRGQFSVTASIDASVMWSCWIVSVLDGSREISSE